MSQGSQDNESQEKFSSITNESPEERSRPPRKHKTRGYLIIFLLGIAVGVIGFEVHYVMNQSHHTVDSTTLAAKSIHDSPEKILEFDRVNFEDDKDHIQALQTSIPATDTIKAFNGATLSLNEFDAIKKTIKHFKDKSHSVSFVMINLKTGKGVAYNTNELYYSASAIKAPYIASLLAKDSLNSERATDPQLNNLIQNILIWSDNDSYFELFERFGGDAFYQWNLEANLDHPVESGRCFMDFTSSDLAKMWLQIYSDYTQGYIDEDIRALTTNPEVSAIHPTLEEKAITWSKGGWIPNIDDLSATNDAGIVKTPRSTYLLSVCSDTPSNFFLMNEMVHALSKLETSLM